MKDTNEIIDIDIDNVKIRKEGSKPYDESSLDCRHRNDCTAV